MTYEAFAYGNSFLHRLDPRGKIVAAIIFCGFIAIMDASVALMLGLAYGIMLLLAARLAWVPFLRRLLLFNLFIFFVWLLILTYPGETIFRFGPFAVSDKGIKLAAVITLKANVIFLITVALITTIPLISLGHALTYLGLPAKFVHLFMFTCRYMHVLEEEFDKLLQTISIRGFSPATNMHTYRTFAYVIGMLLVRSINRAERIQEAMLCRGFAGKYYSLTRFSLGPHDFLFAAVISMLLLSVWWVGWLMM